MTILAAATPTVEDGKTFAGFSDGAVVSLNASTGEVLHASWVGEGRYPDIASSVAVDGNMIFVSGFERPFLALNHDFSATMWSKEIGASSMPLIHDKVVYHPGVDGTLRAFDVLTGDLKWSWRADSRAALTQPILVNNSLLVGSSGQGMALLGLEDGRLLWETPPTIPLNGIVGQPEVSGNQIIALSSAGNLFSFEFPTSQPTGLGCPKLFCEWANDE